MLFFDRLLLICNYSAINSPFRPSLSLRPPTPVGQARVFDRKDCVLLRTLCKVLFFDRLLLICNCCAINSPFRPSLSLRPPTPEGQARVFDRKDCVLLRTSCKILFFDRLLLICNCHAINSPFRPSLSLRPPTPEGQARVLIGGFWPLRPKCFLAFLAVHEGVVVDEFSAEVFEFLHEVGVAVLDAS